MSPPTLPGDIVGLLRRGSPVVWRGEAGWTLAGMFYDRGLIILPCGDDDKCGDWEDLADLALDLSDPTGRVHAAWWLRRNAPRDADHDAPCYPSTAAYDAGEAALAAVYLATDGDVMGPDEIDTLRRACLAVAGR